jgi:secreted trypsin-like serine protease
VLQFHCPQFELKCLFHQGDTGGPVVYMFPNDVAVTLVGINSQYQACPSAYPMAYTRVAPYYGWIKSKVQKLLT